MTTIAWDGKLLAADTQLTVDNIKTVVRKILTVDPLGWVWAAAGEVDKEVEVLQFLKGEGPEPAPKRLREFEAICIDKEGKVFLYQEAVHPIPISSFIAIGSGGKIAMAAMHLGLDAKAAVGVASELDVNTNKYIDTYCPATKEFKYSKWPE